MPHGDKSFTIPFKITDDLTLPKVLMETAKKYGHNKAAMREKEFGLWKPITWQDYLDRVKYIALGLISLGLKAALEALKNLYSPETIAQKRGKSVAEIR